MAYFPSLATFSPWSNVTGNCTLSGYGASYLWSGQGLLSWTGTLAAPGVISGAVMTIKSVHTGASLLITGSVDYGINCTVSPYSCVVLRSDGSTWLRLF